MKTPPREQVEQMDTISYFKLLAELMKQNPPYAADAPMLARLARIGLVPGQDFDASKLASVPNVQDVPKLGVERIAAHFPASGADVNGWTFFKPGGRYGTDYIRSSPQETLHAPRFHFVEARSSGVLALALVGFNLGVEVGQIAIVAIFLPLAYLLRRTWLYRSFVLAGGSSAIVVVAALWFVERAFDLKFLPVH